MGVFWSLIIGMTIIELLFVILGISESARKAKCVIYWISISLVLGLRSPQNGVDLIGYCPMFERISSFTWTEAFCIPVMNYEQGYTVYNKILSCFSNDIHFFLLITAFINIGLISWIIYKYSPNVYLSFIIFISFGLYTMCFSGLRQALAFSITFYSFHYLVKGNLLKFIAVVILASTFHTSALIFIFSWFIRKIRLTFNRAFTLLSIYCLLVLPSLRLIVPLLTSLLFGDKYGEYQDEGGAVTMAFVYLIVFISSYIIKAKDSQLLQILRWMILLSVVFQSLGFISTGALPRIAYYFNIFYCLFIPQMLTYLKQLDRKLLSCVVTILFIIFFQLTMSTGYLNIVPYHFYWEPGWSNPLPLSK